jgi:hypothetical protein
VSTVKNMFERQIRLSRYDADKVLSATTPAGSRMSSQHRDVSSPVRSRSMSPIDATLRQRRTSISGPILPIVSVGLSLPLPTSYPDLVISHTPPTETTKPSNEPMLINTHSDLFLLNNQIIHAEKKSFVPSRSAVTYEQSSPLTVIVDDSSVNMSHHQRPNLLLSSTATDIVHSQQLDFKSRLALFNRTNTQSLNDISTMTNTSPGTAMTMVTANRKSPNQTSSSVTNLVSKPTVQFHPPARPVMEDKKESTQETSSHLLLNMPIARSVVHTGKAVTFFGGSKLNGNSKSSLPNSIPAPPIQSSIHDKSESLSISTATDLFRAPDVIGGNIQLSKSSIFSGTKKVFIHIQIVALTYVQFFSVFMDI